MQLQSMDYLCCPVCNGSFKLSIKEKVDAEVVGGALECSKCKRHFEITDGLPNLIFPETLEESDICAQTAYDRSAELYDLRIRWQALKMGIWDEAFMPARHRQTLVDKLELKSNSSVLDTSTGTGGFLPAIADQIGKEGQLHGFDISSKMLKVAQGKMRARRIQAGLLIANSSYLPYRTAMFDAVLHCGGWNTFAEKKRAMEEMHRVAKPGAKIVICDEGLAPGKENSRMGRRILSRDVEGVFSMKPPRELVPENTECLKAYYIWHDIYWVLEFKKSA